MSEPDKHLYLLRIQFLGFRYSGWQQQPRVKTVEGMLLKTLRFVLPGRKVKLLGAGRTDSMVSALDFGVQLILSGPPLDSEKDFHSKMNQNLPADIRLISVQGRTPDFNAIRDCRHKTYRYYFTYGTKPHPFCAPLLGFFSGDLDIRSMRQAVSRFEGTHNFKGFIVQPSENTRIIRQVDHARLEVNTEFTASFFPENTYFFEVGGPGFGRYQVRVMMTALLALGRGAISARELEGSLETGGSLGLSEIVPASGLQLVKVVFAEPGI
jgi:tRNA pseudouridine38-40 synthase